MCVYTCSHVARGLLDSILSYPTNGQLTQTISSCPQTEICFQLFTGYATEISSSFSCICSSVFCKSASLAFIEVVFISRSMLPPPLDSFLVRLRLSFSLADRAAGGGCSGKLTPSAQGCSRSGCVSRLSCNMSRWKSGRAASARRWPIPFTSCCTS